MGPSYSAHSYLPISENIYPFSIVTAGNDVYYSDPKNHRIYKVDRSSLWLTPSPVIFAGTGSRGYDETIGNAATTPFNRPHGIVLDITGHFLVVCDTINFAIRAVSLDTNLVTTIGILIFLSFFFFLSSFLSFLPSFLLPFFLLSIFLSLLFALVLAGVPTVNGYSGDGDLATEAHLFSPFAITKGLARNSDSCLYFTDLHACTVRMIDTVTGIITTVMGIPYQCDYNGDTGIGTEVKLNKPYSVTFDGYNLFVADSRNNMIRQYDVVSSEIVSSLRSVTTALGTVPLSFPTVVYWNSKNGILYFTEKVSSNIRGVTFPLGGLLPTTSSLTVTLSLETKVTHNAPVTCNTPCGSNFLCLLFPQTRDPPYCGDVTINEETVPSTFNHIKGIISSDGPDTKFYVADSGHHRILHLFGSLNTDVINTSRRSRKLFSSSSSYSSSLSSLVSMFALTSSSTSSIIPTAILITFLVVSFLLVFMFLREKMKKKDYNKKYSAIIDKEEEEQEDKTGV
jgi:hypothetical protein